MTENVERPQIEVHQPTYIMAPKDDEKFLPSKVTEVIEKTMAEFLGDKEYNDDDAKAWTLNLSNEIKKAVKELNMKRHKIIVQVVIGEQASQGVRVASKCLWDVSSDNWASGSFTNQSIFAVGMVFGCYYE
jgi:hypothetical protein